MKSNYVNYVHESNLELHQLDHSLNWLNWIIVFICLILVIVARQANYIYISNLFKRNRNIAENSNSLKKLSSIALIINYYLISSLFIWQYLIDINILNLNRFSLFIIVTASVLGVSLLKFLLIYLIDITFKRKNHFHIYYHISFQQIVGLIVLPLYIFSTFLFPNQKLDLFLNTAIHKIDIYILALIIFCLTIIYRETKSLFTALNNRISLLYIILYLCTLEILPLILVIKILKG